MVSLGVLVAGAVAVAEAGAFDAACVRDDAAELFWGAAVEEIVSATTATIDIAGLSIRIRAS